MHIFYGIDGTSNSDKSAQAITCDLPTAMAQSPNRHVKRIMRFGFMKSRYVEGTFDEMTGQSSHSKIKDAVNWIEQSFRSTHSRHTKVFLSGFSRGGAASLCVAHELDNRGVPVHAMYLFDAVDRAYVMPNGQTSHPPKNVRYVYHALRDPNTGSRRTFGNCGVENRFQNLTMKKFKTTHGGVGGWPYGDTSLVTGKAAVPGSFLLTAAAALRDRGHVGHIHERGEPLPTNLTPDQEAAGMKDAWTWMSSHVTTSMNAREVGP